ncbi:MAG: PorT family protein [Tannerella sp.]|nr:PorT family protein [Tannerella sp.]
MKKWICIGIATLLAGGMKAQIAFGIRAGISYASLTQLIEEEVRSGGRIGFSMAGLTDIPLSPRFSLRPEIAIVNLGGTYYMLYRTDKQIEMERHRSNYYSIQAPINMVYKIFSNDWQFGIYGGPSVAVSTQVREKTLREEERKFRPFDVGAGAGFYVQFRRVFSSIYVHTGILDRQTRKSSGESQLYQNNVVFSLGYWFR